MNALALATKGKICSATTNTQNVVSGGGVIYKYRDKVLPMYRVRSVRSDSDEDLLYIEATLTSPNSIINKPPKFEIIDIRSELNGENT